MTVPATMEPVLPGPAAIATRTQRQQIVRALRSDRPAMAALAIIVVLGAIAVCAPLIAIIVGHGPNQLRGELNP